MLWKITGIIGILCIVYYLIIIFYAGFQANFSKFWAAAGISCLAASVLKFHVSLPGTVKLVGGILLLVVISVFFAVEARIVFAMSSKNTSDLEYVIVLGARVRGETPSKSLYKRLQRAEKYLKENPSTIAVLSGGQGFGEDISEAEAMRRYLTAHGICKDRLRSEDQSTNTKENMKYSFAIIGDQDTRTGVITNNFHVYRSVAIGKKMGYKNLEGVAASSSAILQVNYMVREFFAVIKDKFIGNI